MAKIKNTQKTDKFTDNNDRLWNFLFFRPRRYCKRQPQTYSRSDMASDSSIPDWEEQVPDKETYVGMVTSCYPRRQCFKLYIRLEWWNRLTVSIEIGLSKFINNMCNLKTRQNWPNPRAKNSYRCICWRFYTR